MAIIPTGAPAWLRTNNFASYGGHLQKKNFASRGAINPKTDVSAEAFSRVTSDLAAIEATAPLAVFTILCHDTTPAEPTVEYAALMTGVRTASYEGGSPPTGFPTVHRTGNGMFSLTFPATLTDPYGVVGAVNLQNPDAQLVSATAGIATAERLDPLILRVWAFAAAGTALSDARVTVTVGSSS